MTSSALTLGGYALIAIAAIAIELRARRTGRLATFGDALDRALRHWPFRILLQAGWLWLGWHVFVRADWR